MRELSLIISKIVLQSFLLLVTMEAQLLQLLNKLVTSQWVQIERTWHHHATNSLAQRKMDALISEICSII